MEVIRDPERCLDGADAAVLATEWERFSSVQFSSVQFRKLGPKDFLRMRGGWSWRLGGPKIRGSSGRRGEADAAGEGRAQSSALPTAAQSMSIAPIARCAQAYPINMVPIAV